MPSPRGRPPLPRGVYAFDAADWTPAEVVVLDTNVVAEALLPSEPEHAACLSALQALGDAGTTVIFNELLEVELWQVLFNVALRERHPSKQLRHVRYDDRVRPRAARLLKQGQDAWEAMLSTLTYVRVPLSDVMPAVPDIIRAYGLESNDAVHVATLTSAGVADFLTRDAGFAKVPPSEAVLHTTQARLKNTRRRRMRAGH